ncbi:MAG: tyrosine-type recombinase/integrase family protein [Thermoleophilaceae bacterium]|nr:tyrosine-type recombinase/integrase family protein [Thermoleophilaceae bacterium]
MARPRTPVGAYGSIAVRRRGERVIAETRIRDADGRLRHVRVTARTAAQARQVLKERLLDRPTFGSTRVLTPQSTFADLAEVWLADLAIQRLAEGTKQNYRDQVRLHVLPAFEQYALAEITTGRVEWFLKSQAAISPSRARQSRTLLNLLFGFALRHDAVSRNPVAGTSPLRHPKSQPKALTLDQIAAIREAAANWRSEPGLPGPKPDGQVRDIIEVLLGTAMRTGEVLALRPCDLDDRPTGMVAAVTGTVVQRKGQGAIRQDRPKSEASIRWIPVPAFAASVLRRRATGVSEARTIFANRRGGPLSPYNVRRTFRDFLVEAGLGDSGISLRWYRRTGATVIARGMGSDAAAAFLGHSSTAITEGHYIERDPTVDRTPAAHLERTLRPVRPDDALLVQAAAVGEDALLAAVDHEKDDDAVA